MKIQTLEFDVKPVILSEKVQIFSLFFVQIIFVNPRKQCLIRKFLLNIFGAQDVTQFVGRFRCLRKNKDIQYHLTNQSNFFHQTAYC